ncbi:MAG: nucleotidyl transferase AbiEii/AbiGii toxin family protein [Candidatus Saccharicenans sp.]|uniref:nucleotidyl transferase AbiEii/AbiGii toxin family protein n=1 Tax=Candidatus Saccharicenans sp. TaxID=2819258 RepID=UPI0040492DAF
MNEIINQMLAAYEIKSVNDSLWALREIIQQVALLGLWRSKFFEKAAFYGGSALRILYGIDRFSEDLDFSLLKTDQNFNLLDYSQALKRELLSFGFNLNIETRVKRERTTIQSAFLKSETRKQLIFIGINPELIKQIPHHQVIKIKLEVDITPPAGFLTEMCYLLKPIPFSVRTFSLPDMFAGKMHAILCRQWKSRLKGRDWYDLVWFAAYHPELRLAHLEQRMRQTGHWEVPEPLSEKAWRELLKTRIESVDIQKIKKEVEPFVKNPAALDVWSREFFLEVAEKIKVV